MRAVAIGAVVVLLSLVGCSEDTERADDNPISGRILGTERDGLNFLIELEFRNDDPRRAYVAGCNLVVLDADDEILDSIPVASRSPIEAGGLERLIFTLKIVEQSRSPIDSVSLRDCAPS